MKKKIVIFVLAVLWTAAWVYCSKLVAGQIIRANRVQNHIYDMARNNLRGGKI